MSSSYDDKEIEVALSAIIPVFLRGTPISDCNHRIELAIEKLVRSGISIDNFEIIADLLKSFMEPE
jgi:hypothetical protein